MKQLFFLFLIFFTIRLQAQQPDSTATNVVAANIKVVSDFLEKKDSSLQKISEAIDFLNQISGVYNENYGKYYGQFKPTSNDLQNWTTWLERNQSYLKWDKEVRSVIIYKRVRLLIN